jgi:hypothetical protein
MDRSLQYEGISAPFSASISVFIRSLDLKAPCLWRSCSICPWVAWKDLLTAPSDVRPSVKGTSSRYSLNWHQHGSDLEQPSTPYSWDSATHALFLHNHTYLSWRIPTMSSPLVHLIAPVRQRRVGWWLLSVDSIRTRNLQQLICGLCGGADRLIASKSLVIG